MDNFDKAGYGRQNIGIGEKCALLIVDFQIGFTSDASPIGGSDHVNAAVDKTVELVGFARGADMPIASCRTSWNGPEDMAHWKVAPLYDGGFFHGHKFTEIDPRLSDPDNHFEFIKSAPSIFFLTPLLTWLTKHNVDTTIITGCTTSGCIRASVIDSFSYGYRTIVAEDCCGDQDADAHADNIRDVGRRYADVMSCAEIIKALS